MKKVLMIMTKVHTFLLPCFLFGVDCFAQPTILAQKTIGGNNYDGFKVDLYTAKDGGLIVGGSSYSNKSGQKTQNIRGVNDYWVVKMNEHRKIQWDRTIGGISSEVFKAVIRTYDGGYALIGESESYTSVEKDEDSRGGTDYWIVKLDKEGNVQWNKTIGGAATELIDNIVQTADGGYILAGSSESYPSGEKSEYSRGFYDYWVVKLDKRGTIQWDKTIGGADYEFCSGVELTNDGGVIICGFSQSNVSGEKSENSRGEFDTWIVKLNKNGNIQWDKTIGGSGGDFGRGIKQTKDGGYVISSASYSNISGEKTENSRGGFDYWVVKLDNQGHFVKDKTIGGNSDDNDVWCLEKTSDGGFIFGGGSYSNISGEKSENSRGDYDYWVIKLDKNLNIQWDKTIGGSGYDVLYTVKEVDRNRFVVGGLSWSDISGDKTESNRGVADYWIVWLNNGKTHEDDDHESEEHESEKSNRFTIGEERNSLTIGDLSKEKTFSVYPNPAKNTFYIHTNGKVTIIVTDQSGKIILTRSIDRSCEINIDRLAPGTYFIKNNATAETQKIIVIK